MNQFASSLCIISTQALLVAEYQIDDHLKVYNSNCYIKHYSHFFTGRRQMHGPNSFAANWGKLCPRWLMNFRSSFLWPLTRNRGDVSSFFSFHQCPRSNYPTSSKQNMCSKLNLKVNVQCQRLIITDYEHNGWTWNRHCSTECMKKWQIQRTYI